MIILKDVEKKFGSHTILNNFSMSIQKNEMVAIVGTSGSGKSTILNIIGLLDRPSSGDIYLDGIKNVNPNGRKALMLLRNKISYLFQNYALIDNETVESNLKLAIKFSKGKGSSIAEALETVGLEGYEKRLVFTLSGGEQQRVAMARLLVKPSEIILADEPTGNLDEENAIIIMKLFKILQKRGKTIVIATHDRHLLNYFDRVIEIEHSAFE